MQMKSAMEEMEEYFSKGKSYTPAIQSEAIEYFVNTFSSEPDRVGDKVIVKWEELRAIDAEAKMKSNVLMLDYTLDIVHAQGFENKIDYFG